MRKALSFCSGATWLSTRTTRGVVETHRGLYPDFSLQVKRQTCFLFSNVFFNTHASDYHLHTHTHTRAGHEKQIVC